MKSKNLLPIQASKFNKFVLVRWPNDKPGEWIYNAWHLRNLNAKKFNFNKTKRPSLRRGKGGEYLLEKAGRLLHQRKQ